jgi:hypothetical protein
MARIRTVKPEFFTSPSTAAVDHPVRIFYQAMWCAADDFGVGETNFNALLGLAFPDSDGLTAQDVRRFCADCAQHYDVVFYTVRGRHYYAVRNWEEHQKLERRTNRRRHPTPDDPEAMPDQRIYGCAENAPEVSRKTGAGTGEREQGKGNREQGKTTHSAVSAALVAIPASEAPDKPTPRKKGTRIPSADWMPQPATVDQVKADFPGITADQLRHEHNRFIDWATGSASRNAVKLDWDATWRGWMRRELAKVAVVGRRPSKTDQGIAETQALKSLYPVPNVIEELA